MAKYEVTQPSLFKEDGSEAEIGEVIELSDAGAKCCVNKVRLVQDKPKAKSKAKAKAK